MELSFFCTKVSPGIFGVLGGWFMDFWWLGLWLGNCYCWGFFGGQGVCGFLDGGLQTCDLCMTFLFI